MTLSSLFERLRDSPSRWIAYGILTGLAGGTVAIVFFVLLELATHVTLGLLAGMPPPQPPGDSLAMLEGLHVGEPRR